MTIKKVAKRLKARLLGTARTDQTIAAAKAFAEQGAWEATIASLADIVTSESTPTATRRLYVTALRRAGRLEEAAAEIGIALAMHPNDLGLLIESSAISFELGDFSASEHVLAKAVDEYGLSTPAPLLIRHSRTLRKMKRWADADAAINRALEQHGVSSQIMSEWVAIASDQHNWPETALRLDSAVTDLTDQAPAKLWADRVTVRFRLDEPEAARVALAEATARAGSHSEVILVSAHAAMSALDWPAAISAWTSLLDGDAGFILPVFSSYPPWFSSAWDGLTDYWLKHNCVTTAQLSVIRGVSDVLVRSNQTSRAIDFLRHYRVTRPDDVDLRFIETRLLAGQSHASESDFARALGDLLTNDMHRLAAANRQIFEGAPPEDLTIRHISVPPATSLESKIITGHFYDARRTRREIRYLAEHTRWPEFTSSPNPQERIARRIAERYVRRYPSSEESPDEAQQAAAAAIIHPELWTSVAIARLARTIIRAHPDEPIFVESPRQLTYFNGYFDNDFEQFVLYVELARRRANVFLCDFIGTPVDQILFQPHSSFMAHRSASQTTEDPTAAAIVPAGIRSPGNVIEQIDSPTVFASTAIIPEFAYEETREDIHPTSSFMPPRSLLPSISIELSRADSLELHDTRPGDLPPASIPIMTSEPLTPDWLFWVNRTVSDYVADMNERCQQQVTESGVQHLHIADYPHLESAIAAGIVKNHGGTVTLWPHSTNPAHVGTYRPGLIDTVFAVTKTGAEEWLRASADWTVRRTSHVLRNQSPPAEVSDSAPLNIVVIGGKSRIGPMPFVNQTEHEQSYVAFFRAVEILQRDYPIDLFYKPKGNGLEDADWLHQVVGNTAQWRTIRTHPLKMNLPNLLFVSISLGSAALLEGIGRSIPALIVRDTTCQQYLAVADGLIPELPSSETISVLRGLVDSKRRSQMAQDQLTGLRAEIDPAGAE